jgi:hypothetical protein
MIKTPLKKGTAIAEQIAQDAPRSAGRHVKFLDEDKRQVGIVQVGAQR